MRYRILSLAALAALAAHAVQMASQPWVTNRIAEAVAAIPAARADLTPATNYTDAVAATLRAKSDLAYRNAAHNGIEKWVVTIQGETATLTAEWNDDFQQWFNQDPPVNGLGIKIAASGYILSTTGGEFPFALSGDSATASDGWFTYTLTPVRFAEDRLALVNDVYDAISTNNAAFVAAVTNCPVVLTSGGGVDYGDFGQYGTIGALLAALAAAVVALRKGKANAYDFSAVQTISSAGTEQLPNEVTPVDAQNKRVSVEAANAHIAVALPAASANGHIRDFMLTLDCSLLTDGQEPNVTWSTHFHPRTDAGTDFACAAGVRNVYYISEYAQGEFVVGGWQETEGGNA